MRHRVDRLFRIMQTNFHHKAHCIIFCIFVKLSPKTYLFIVNLLITNALMGFYIRFLNILHVLVLDTAGAARDIIVC